MIRSACCDILQWSQPMDVHSLCCDAMARGAESHDGCHTCSQVLKVSHDVSEQLSRLQGGFKRTLMTESKAFKAEATAFRSLPSIDAQSITYRCSCCHDHCVGVCRV